MRSLLPDWVLAFAIVSVVFLVSCREELTDPAIVEFTVAEQSLTEGDTISVFLKISGITPENGMITVNIGQPSSIAVITADSAIENGQIKISVNPGQSLYRLRLMTFDDTLLSGDRSIPLTLGNISPGIKLGSFSELMLQVRDDELPSAANFAAESATIREGISDGLVVQIPLSVPVQGEGSGKIEISMTMIGGTWGYGTKFTTVPAATDNYSVVLDVGPGDGAASFFVYAVNNDHYEGDRQVLFQINGTSGTVLRGNNREFTLTIKEDEKPTQVNFLSSAYEIREDDLNGVLIDMVLDPPASSDCQFIVSLVDPDMYGRDYLTEPSPLGGLITMNVKKGDARVAFRFFPISAPSCQNREVRFVLQSATCGYQEEKPLAITIREKDPILASWTVSSGSVADTSREGIPIQISLSRPAATNDNVTVFILDGSYLSHYSTFPPFEHPIYGDWNFFGYPVVNWLQVQIPQGASTAQFTVYPADLNSGGASYLAKFQIQEVGYCISAPPNEFFTLTILDR